MAKRFIFTTRDWFWLCTVIALAIGWGTHVRCSTLLESHETGAAIRPASKEELEEQEQLAREHADRYKWEEKWRSHNAWERERAGTFEQALNATQYAIKKTLNTEQIERIK